MADKVTAIVLAAGKGSRMNRDIPKQYLDLLGKPVLFYSLQAFEESAVDEVILVVGRGEEEYCRKKLIQNYGLNKVKYIAEGGAERYHSVQQGLNRASDASYVLIHDGARPLITPSIINAAINKVKKCKACVVGMPAKDTMQLVDKGGNIISTPDRSRLWMAQTPQCFEYELVLSSYNKAIAAGDSSITDDAMVVRRYGEAVDMCMLEGSYENIKITTPEDIDVASCFLKKREMTQKMIL